MIQKTQMQRILPSGLPKPKPPKAVTFSGDKGLSTAAKAFVDEFGKKDKALSQTIPLDLGEVSEFGAVEGALSFIKNIKPTSKEASTSKVPMSKEAAAFLAVF